MSDDAFLAKLGDTCKEKIDKGQKTLEELKEMFAEGKI